MSRISKFVCISLLSIAAMSSAGSIAPAHAKPPLNQAIKRQQHRNVYVRFEDIVESLELTPGMTILDIGSGPGYASFLFAEKLRGTGQVFATDVREDFVGHIADEARRRGLGNLFPVVVREEGLDDFYGKHRYDLVFLSNVYHCLDNRIEYFGKLRRFLNRGARLVVVLYDQTPLFSADELSDVDKLAENLSRGADDDPFLRNLSPRTRELLGDRVNREELEKALVGDFNRMLVDPGFYRNFYRNPRFRKDLFTEAERDLANWLLMTIGEDGTLDKPADRIDARAMRAVIRLNRLFFAKRFGDSLLERGKGAYVPAGDANRHTSKYVMLRELDAAGYRFVREFRLSPYFDAVIMAPGTP